VGGGEKIVPIGMVASAWPRQLQGVQVTPSDRAWMVVLSTVKILLRPEARVVVVHMGRPPPLLVCWLAHSIVVRPPKKRTIARRGGWCPTAVSLATAEWSL
jgi:hypothetical protein